MQQPKTTILTGAEIDTYAWAGNEIAKGDTIICADSGARHAKAMNLTPNIIIGDFDSIDPDLLNFYEGQCEIIHAPDQNTTDLMKALQIAQNGTEIKILGATGQRADHDFATYLILLNLENPDNIVIKTPHDERRLIKNSFTFEANIGDNVGVFPLLPINTLSYDGLEYPAEGLGGPYEFGWNGACNKVIAPQVTINLDSGAALVTRTYAT